MAIKMALPTKKISPLIKMTRDYLTVPPSQRKLARDFSDKEALIFIRANSLERINESFPIELRLDYQSSSTWKIAVYKWVADRKGWHIELIGYVGEDEVK